MPKGDNMKKKTNDLLKKQIIQGEESLAALGKTVDLYSKIRDEMRNVSEPLPQNGGFLLVNGEKHNLVNWKLRMTDNTNCSNRTILTFVTDYLGEPGQQVEITLYGRLGEITKIYTIKEIMTESHGGCQYICWEN